MSSDASMNSIRVIDLPVLTVLEQNLIVYLFNLISSIIIIKTSEAR